MTILFLTISVLCSKSYCVTVCAIYKKLVTIQILAYVNTTVQDDITYLFNRNNYVFLLCGYNDRHKKLVELLMGYVEQKRNVS